MAELVEAILIVQLAKGACVGGVEASLDILIEKDSHLMGTII